MSTKKKLTGLNSVLPYQVMYWDCMQACWLVMPTDQVHACMVGYPSWNPHTQHSCPLVVPFARTNAFQSTFFIDCCSSWNDLPEHVITAPSPLSCKRHLQAYFTWLIICFVYTSCFVLFVVITIVLSVTTHCLLFFLLCYLPFIVLYTIIAESCIHYPFCHCCCPSLSSFLFFFLYFSLFFCSNLANFVHRASPRAGLTLAFSC